MTATIFLWNGKIAIQTDNEDFDGNLAKVRSIPGRRWKPKEKISAYPRSVETCLAARAAFGDDLVIDKELGAWYRAEKEQRDQHAQMAAAPDATLARLPSVAPALLATLRPDQRAGVAWVAQGYRQAGLLADAPGTGKTIEVVGGLLERYGDRPFVALITCPKVSVKNVWGREFEKWAPQVSVHLARGTREEREAILQEFRDDDSLQKVLVIVAEMTRIIEVPECICGKPYTSEHVAGKMISEHCPNEGRPKVFGGYAYPVLFEYEWDTIVVDESQRWMGSLTIVKGTLAGKGFKRLRQPANGYRLAVSATPFGRGGRVQGMFGTLMWLWPDEFTSFWRWAGTYFQVEEEEVYIRGGHGMTKTVKRINGLARGNEEEFLHSFGPRLLRRTKAEVLPFLPPKQFIEVLCEMEEKQSKQYDQLSRDAEVKTSGGMVVANGALAEITRAKQVANGEIFVDGDGTVAFTGVSGKLEALWEKMEARGILDGDGEGKIIVTSQFNKFLNVVANRLRLGDVPFHMMTGSTSDAKRDRAMDEFQSEGGARVFLMNSKAGGVSITLDAADDVHCLDELWNPEDQEQLEDRAHRASRVHQVTIYHYRSEDTIDQNIAEDVEAKRLNQHKIMDGRRGLEYARSLIRHRHSRKGKAA